MKKIVSILTVLFMTISLHGQEAKPGKFTVEDGFLTTRYYIGDKRMTTKEVQLHLQKTMPDSDAPYFFKRAQKQGTSAAVWSIVGAVGTIGGLLSEKPENALAWYGVAIVGYSVSLGCIIGSNSKERKARTMYNTRYGY